MSIKRRSQPAALNASKVQARGRSLRHLVDVVAQLEQRHVAFESLREKIDTTTAGAKLQLHIFAALAEFERELIRERSQAGREVAKAAGRLGGRPRRRRHSSCGRNKGLQ